MGGGIGAFWDVRGRTEGSGTGVGTGNLSSGFVDRRRLGKGLVNDTSISGDVEESDGEGDVEEEEN